MNEFRLVICASASFYPKVIEKSYELEKLGINIVLPKTAQKMKAQGLQNVEVITDWSQAPNGYRRKAALIREHFKEIERSDAILVMNYEKHGKPNYIGPNVLMEMSTAFYLEKPIYVLNGVPEHSSLIDEILGVEPIFLHGDITRLSF